MEHYTWKGVGDVLRVTDLLAPSEHNKYTNTTANYKWKMKYKTTANYKWKMKYNIAMVIFSYCIGAFTLH